MSDLFQEACELEPEKTTAPERDGLAAFEIEPDEPATVDVLPAAPSALMRVLPADFPLPALIRFVPNPQYRLAADEAATYALSVVVSGEPGLTQADAALVAVRDSLKAIEDHFADPCEIANKLHKSLTGTRAEWTTKAKLALDTVGKRIYAEQRRLQALEDDRRRREQEAADRQAREEARRAAEAAAAAQAPAPVVEELQRQAETARAAPVPAPSTAKAALKNTSVTKNWTCTLLGTPRDAEQHPEVEQFTNEQRRQFLVLLSAVIDGRAPIAAATPNWSYLKKRAKADESTLQIAGIEAYDAGGTRSKGTRARA